MLACLCFFPLLDLLFLQLLLHLKYHKILALKNAFLLCSRVYLTLLQKWCYFDLLMHLLVSSLTSHFCYRHKCVTVFASWKRGKFFLIFSPPLKCQGLIFLTFKIFNSHILSHVLGQILQMLFHCVFKLFCKTHLCHYVYSFHLACKNMLWDEWDLFVFSAVLGLWIQL